MAVEAKILACSRLSPARSARPSRATANRVKEFSPSCDRLSEARARDRPPAERTVESLGAASAHSSTALPHKNAPITSATPGYLQAKTIMLKSSNTSANVLCHYTRGRRVTRRSRFMAVIARKRQIIYKEEPQLDLSLGAYQTSYASQPSAPPRDRRASQAGTAPLPMRCSRLG